MLDAAFLVVLLGAIPVGAAVWLHDRAARQSAYQSAEQAWVRVQPAMTGRLKQSQALEYGAVWATHAGTLCGMVNGWGSFGGLSGMTPFYVQNGKPVFAPDVSETVFSPGWRDCLGDPWIELLKGSMESGWCASRQGAKTCKMVEG
jgi:hypothetical protein